MKHIRLLATAALGMALFANTAAAEEALSTDVKTLDQARAMLEAAAGISGATTGPSSPAADGIPAGVTKVISDVGGKVEGKFEAGPGLVGYVVDAGRGRGIVYHHESGYSFIGTLFDAGGLNVTADHMQEKVYDLAGSLDRIRKDGFLITKGKKSLPVYAFYEPHCHYCIQAIKELDAKGIDVQFVPVMFLKQETLPVMASIWAQKDPYKALMDAANAHEGQKLAEWALAHPANEKSLEKARSAIELHSTLMKRAGINGTPTFVAEVDGKPKLMTTEDVIKLFAKGAKG